MRHVTRVLIAATALLLPSAALAGKASTTRIETRPFYGATVTLEEGVRVFRPLPHHDRVIINPGGRTPLSLSFEENRTYNYDRGGDARDAAARESGDGVGGVPAYGAPAGDGGAYRGQRTAAKRNVPIGRERFAPAPARQAPHHGAKH